MPDAEVALSADEERELEAFVAEGRAWIADAAERASPGAAASAAILAAINAYEDAFGTEALAEMLKVMSGTATGKVMAGPHIGGTH